MISRPSFVPPDRRWTVLFLGYSDNQLGTNQFSLERTDRTFFFKVGYAWVM